MAEIAQNPDGTVEIELDDDEMLRAALLAEERIAVPVFEVVEDYWWATPSGYEIVYYTHRRAYPAHLRLPGIYPGRTEEQRGWPRPNCGSTDTSRWVSQPSPTMPRSDAATATPQAHGSWNAHEARHPCTSTTSATAHPTAAALPSPDSDF